MLLLFLKVSVDFSVFNTPYREKHMMHKSQTKKHLSNKEHCPVVFSSIQVKVWWLAIANASLREEALSPLPPSLSDTVCGLF